MHALALKRDETYEQLRLRALQSEDGRLVLADWMEERGRGDVAALLRAHSAEFVIVSERPHTLVKNPQGRLVRVAWDGWEVRGEQ